MTHTFHIPDTFELRVARVLTSFDPNELHFKSGPNSNPDTQGEGREWEEFYQRVAGELAQRFPSAGELCGFVRQQVHEFKSSVSQNHGGALLGVVAEISPEWCSSLLRELLSTKDDLLDRSLWSVIAQANKTAPEAYLKAVERLPVEGRAGQLSSFIGFFGYKHLHGGGLSALEMDCVLQAITRPEADVKCTLALIASHHFVNGSELGLKILVALKPTDERTAIEVLRALSSIFQGRKIRLSPQVVALCLENIGEYCLAKTVSDESAFRTIAGGFPKQVYEHICKLHERAEAEPSTRHPRGFPERISLGGFVDRSYVADEVHRLWQKAISAESGTFSQAYPLAMIRSLLWSGRKPEGDEIMTLVSECKSAKELQLVTELAVNPGSPLVFQFPDIVRTLIVRAESFNVADEVHELLWSSACGGDHAFTEHELDSGYSYAIARGYSLAIRYADDRVLSQFYRTVADSERKRLERHKRNIAADDSE